MAMVRTRIAPSPTGNAHVGTARNALYNYAFAKHFGGQFILRIDDTDQARSTRESEEGVFHGLRWLGLTWDEGPDVGGQYGPYRQSEKVERYKALADKMIAQGNAYYCFCSRERLDAVRVDRRARGLAAGVYDGACRSLSPSCVQERLSAGEPAVIRVRVDSGQTVSFDDIVLGHGQRRSDDIGDFVIVRADGFPVYHFATVVDDFDMAISHVIRSNEHHENTFKQLLISQSLGYAPPQFAHLPLLLSEKKSKISKRDGAVYIGDYANKGYLPEAMLNFLALLGWGTPDGQELFSLGEFVQMFDLARCSKVNCVFETSKLQFMNKYYIRNTPTENLRDLVLPFLVRDGLLRIDQAETSKSKLTKLVELLRERLEYLTDITEKGRLFLADVEPQANAFLANKRIMKLGRTDAIGLVREIGKLLSDTDDWSSANLERLIKEHLSIRGIDSGPGLLAIRTACLTSAVTPPLFESMELLGKQKCLQNADRMLKAIDRVPEDRDDVRV
jgi:glutamyl-tRNA synthetase